MNTRQVFMTVTCRILVNRRQNEKMLSFVNLNLGRYVVEGTAYIFGVVLSAQRNDVNLIETINCFLRTVDFLLS